MKNLNKIFKNLILIIFIFFLCIYNTKSEGIAAPGDTSVIRVGLEGIYHNMSSMTIRNKAIVLGYCVNNSFNEEITIKGEITLIPYKDSFSVSGSYSSYEDALKAAKDKGNNAIPMLTYVGQWSVATLNSGKTDKYAVRLKSNEIDILYTIDDRGQYPQFASDDGVYVDLGERQYRGRIEIGTYGNSKLKTINIVELEEYLYSVVACEMTASWHMEALKSQAVCARSYAVCQAGFGGSTNVSSPYTINDTSQSQVYRGYNSEHERSIAAVKATTGEMIYYKNQVVRGYYSSTSGGSTENVEDVWGSPYGYLRQVSDIYELNPELDPWIKEFTKDDIKKVLLENNIDVGNITDIRPCIYTNSNRVYAMEVIGDKGKHTITKEKLRIYFSIYSTKYKVVKYGDNPDYVSVVTDSKGSAVDIGSSYIISGKGGATKASQNIDQYVVLSADNLTNYPRVAPKDADTFYLAGMGYGHGVGMSQSGARGMAENGFTYKEILQHYYTNVEIRK